MKPIHSKHFLLGLLLASIGLIVTTIALPSNAAPKDKAAVKIRDEQPSNWTTLPDKQWDDKTRKNFYTTSQGSELMPYDWFIALEQEGSQTPFAQNLERYGFLPNPYDKSGKSVRLPVGFVPDETDETINGLKIKKWVGLTCAACHTGGLMYHKKDQPEVPPTQLIIEGGQSNADFGAFVKDLRLAIQETAQNDDTFARFAKSVNGTDKESDRKKLKAQFITFANQFERVANCFTSDLVWGPGRVDAFGSIFNKASYLAINVDANRHQANAPVSFPFLWNIDRQNKVQWFGGVDNRNIAFQLGRNAGEVLGVFLRLDVVPGNISFHSSIKRINLLKLEHWLHTLKAPKWPVQYFGAIDEEKRSRGEILFNKLKCSTKSCHTTIVPNIHQVPITPTLLKDVDTDDRTTKNIFLSMSLTGKLQGVTILPFQEFGSIAPTGTIVGFEAGHALIPYFQWPWSRAELSKDLQGLNLPSTFFNNISTPPPPITNTGGMSDEEIRAKIGYEARPLNGIWATAPYLHNGSVPNLYELLKPPNDRLMQFNYGTYEFDPVNVGYHTESSYGGLVFDATLPGNKNIGHNYGTDLTPEERYDLIEYLKSL